LTSKDLGVYIHIPFCGSKCHYCDFHSRVCNDPRIVERYTSALISQIKNERFPSEITSVYFGGGTPSVLLPSQADAIITALSEKSAVSSNAEITFEVNPENVAPSFIKSLLATGVNRISMGVQSLEDSELKALGRRATAETCIRAFSIMRECGAENISLDVMLAIPEQTSESLERTLSGVIGLAPEHISAYLLHVSENTVFGKKGVTEQPEEECEEKYLLCSEMLTSAGYEHYEISNFAKCGKRSRHNMLYWTGGRYLAFGSGASGFDGSVRYSFAEDINGYISLNGAVKRREEGTVDKNEELRERIIFGLRISDGIDATFLSETQKRYLLSVCEQGLAERTEKGFRLTPKGFLVSDAVIEHLI